MLPVGVVVEWIKNTPRKPMDRFKHHAHLFPLAIQGQHPSPESEQTENDLARLCKCGGKESCRVRCWKYGEEK